EVFDQAVILVGADGDARGQRVGDRRVDDAFEQAAVVGTDARGQFSFKVVGGCIRNDLDRTAGGVAAEQRPLRPLQHLGGSDVEDAGRGDAVGAHDRHIGNVHANGRIPDDGDIGGL